MYDNDSVIAIDGGCRTSKSRLAKGLSLLLNVPYLDTGLLYRAFADFWKEHSFPDFFDKPIAFYELHSKIEILLDHNECIVITNGVRFNPPKDSHCLDLLTSQIAENIPVRLYITNIVHQFVADNKFIVVGRDIGSFVFPLTQFKVFLTQSYDSQIVGDVKMKAVHERDFRDCNRSFAPLIPSRDQLSLDTSLHSFEENLSIIMNYLMQKGWA